MVRSPSVVLEHHGAPVGLCGEVDVQLAAVAREGQAEQPLLALVDDLVAEVEHRRALELVAPWCRRLWELVTFDQADRAALLGDVEVRRAGPGRHGDGRVELDDLLRRQLDVPEGCSASGAVVVVSSVPVGAAVVVVVGVAVVPAVIPPLHAATISTAANPTATPRRLTTGSPG